MSDAIARRDVGEYVRSMQQDYTAAKVLNPDAVRAVQSERSFLSDQVCKVLGTLVPFVPEGATYEAHVVDSVDVAITTAVADGGQLILVGRHYIMFLRNMIDCLVSGITIGAEGTAAIKVALTDAEKAAFGNTLGEYLELGTPLNSAMTQSDHLGPEILIAAIEFIVAHEITHRVETHENSVDLALTGFQDYCRLRGREYYCDQRAMSLVLHRRKDTDLPELAFVGAISALLALTWVEQFTPGFAPGGEATLHHPGSDSRLLRIHLEEPLFWRAAAIDGERNQLTGAVMRRAFRFMNAFEKQPKLLASPINSLIRRATVGGGLHHDLFELLTGELLARGKVRYVARAMGSMWGSSILMRDEERDNPTILDRVGTLAVPLFERMHDRIVRAGQTAGTVAEELTNARDFQLASQ